MRPRHVVPALVALGAVVLAFLPGSVSPVAMFSDHWFPAVDHRDALAGAHVLAWSTLVPLLTWALRSLPAGLLVTTGLAIGVELVQILVPWREGSWGDMGWNALALALGSLIAWPVHRRSAIGPDASEAPTAGAQGSFRP